MAEIVNLRLARKRSARDRKAQEAEANRTTHGVSKVERDRAAIQRGKADAMLDQHRIEPGDSR